MILYHGTNVFFEQVALSECKPFKDFGMGFYLTPNKRDARARAVNKCNKESFGTPVVLAFHIEEKELEKMEVKRFESVSEEWVDFVLANRDRRNRKHHSFDVVIGPIADDGVILSLQLYEQKVIDKPELIKRLTFARPTEQYCFCTQRAIDALRPL